jgi:chaperone modulatory protein CbpM
MADPRSTSVLIHASVVEEEVELSLDDLSHACRADFELLARLVDEGVLAPAGNAPAEWRFGGASLRRARTALRLIHDLQLEPHSVAIVLDLLDEIAALEARLRRIGQFRA